MKKVPFTTVILGILVLIALVVAGFSSAFALPPSMSVASDEVTAPSADIFLKEIPTTTVAPVAVSKDTSPPWCPVYHEKMADGRTWYAYAGTKTFPHIDLIKPVKIGKEVRLRNADQEVFRAVVSQIFTPPAGSHTKGTWIGFENRAPARGQPASGPAVVFSFWKF